MEEEDDDRPTEAMAVPPVHVDEPGPGVEVGGYVIEGELGHGGMGVVYAATHPVIGKRVAIKVLRPSLSNNPASVERFLQEARAVNQIGHPNIVDIFAFGTLPEGQSYLVMDLLEGESLRKRLKRGALHVREAALVIDEIASALIAAHDKGFAHRDLKPDNVFLVTLPGRTDVKLLDFGLAKLLPGAGTRAFRTATGAQLGTPDYMSPEQLRGADVDHRTDIYALGVMALELFTGRRPRRMSDSTFDLGGQTLREVLAGVPFLVTELAQLVEAMLATDPEERPTLAAVRAVIKRTRPSLPSTSVAGMELPRAITRPPVAIDSLTDMSPSLVGAKPVLPTPPHGRPLPPGLATPAANQPAIGTTLPFGSTVRPPSQPPPNVPAGSITPALRTSGTHPSTTLGVPPPPARPSQSSLAPPRRSSSRTWLVVAIVLVIAAATAFALVLAR